MGVSPLCTPLTPSRCLEEDLSPASGDAHKQRWLLYHLTARSLARLPGHRGLTAQTSSSGGVRPGLGLPPARPGPPGPLGIPLGRGQGQLPSSPWPETVAHFAPRKTETQAPAAGTEAPDKVSDLPSCSCPTLGSGESGICKKNNKVLGRTAPPKENRGARQPTVVPLSL